VLGLVCYKIIKQYLLGNATIVLVSLCAGGVLLILFEYWYRTRRTRAVASEAISYSQAFLIGICQAVAFIPGVSRAAATIVGGLALGLGRNTIVEFSFLLAIPTMLAATALDLLKTRAQLTGTEVGYMIAGFAVSCVVAVASIKFFIRFIQRHDFIAFGIYRIVAALVLWRVIR